MNKFLYALAGVAFILGSCNTDDDAETSGLETDFFPLEALTYWTYNNENEQGSSYDSLYVAGTMQLGGLPYTNLDAKAPPTGFMTNLLAGNALRKTATQLLIKGELGTPVDGFPDIGIPLDDMVLFDTSAAVGQLSTVSGSLEQTVNGFPLTIEYSVSTNHIGELTIAGNIENSLVTNLILNLAITAQIDLGGIIIPVPVLASQDVLVAENIYAPGIGLTDSTVRVMYEFKDLSAAGIALPFPPQSETTATQVLDIFEIGG